MVHRIYVEKKPEYAVAARQLLEECTQLLGIQGLTGLRLVHRYDVEGVSEELFLRCVPLVFSEPPVDITHTALPKGDAVFATEYLPGQFDQRADSAAECIQLLYQGRRPQVAGATVYVLTGRFSPEELAQIKHYVINAVEAREANLAEKQTLAASYPPPPDVAVLDGFLLLKMAEMPAFANQYGFAMDAEDLAFCQQYFKKEGRAPTLTELRMIDTYWSDHCRHTTFLTHLENILITDKKSLSSYHLYQNLREELGRSHKPQTLMDLGTIAAKALRKKGKLNNLDNSKEINACSVKIPVDNNGTNEDWLLLFKNETHNHPTEIEPFGGAATCIGGAIRDPLANRGYVYQAMRVTGAGNPLVPVGETLAGKLPQRKLVVTAANGYSSYGNQVGLATGQVHEWYHPGYVAKRMEIGAVVGAVPLANVRREEPKPGDVVLLLGGRTGRDGCGGATGSSKSHQTESLASCGAEVQKGNPPVERKLQRLFRNPEAVRLIRRCNDFGAGGVAVAVGELADGLRIDLDAVPKKYEGLDGTELAISESQERMAVVVAPGDAQRFIAHADAENLEATPVAVVTREKRLVMNWRGQTIVDIDREFLNSNGAKKHADVRVDPLPAWQQKAGESGSLEQRLRAVVQDLNGCSQKGLAERFDSTIGAASVLMPFGGKYQLTPAQAMVAKLPVEGETTTCSGMAFGFDPFISQNNPYDGAYLAVVESVAKLAAAGFARRDMRLSFQEYFERLRDDPTRWGKPFAALLGALQAQMDLEVAAIGGKDSMSGSFEELDVPPTLVSFAVAPGHTENIISGEFKLPGSTVVWLRPAAGGLLPAAASFKLVLQQLEQLMRQNKVLAVYTPGRMGAAEALFKMGLGNRLGFTLANGFDTDRLFEPAFGSFIVELAEDLDVGERLGEVSGKYVFAAGGEEVLLEGVQQLWEDKLAPVLPYRAPSPEGKVPTLSHSVEKEQRAAPKVGVAKPKALIPVFPGTNCEYDTARALRAAGAEPDVFVVRNLTPEAVAQSAAELARRIDACQMIVLPGGFSGGDEPEGSAKLIAAFFRGAQVAEAVAGLLEQRDGLMLGICNGFQALIKLGLVPHGKIVPPGEDSPTLTFNRIGRHQSMLVRTRVASNLSPWLMHEKTGAVHQAAISHGEGRFAASPQWLQKLADAGQLATQYIDLAGKPTLDVQCNPNGSNWAVEGITSPDGRVFGKMGHTERTGQRLYLNVPAGPAMRLFAGGVDYYKL